MRQYVTGDDLRRIHWPSVAKTGQLMIRQDESTRRSSATIFLDNRDLGLGSAGGPGFEREVSAAASIARGLSRAGFALRLATVDSDPMPVTEEGMLERLAAVTQVRHGSLLEGIQRLRSTALSDTSLALIGPPPSAPEAMSIIRVGTGFGRKVAVFVHPISPLTLAKDAAAELEGRASAARTSLQRAGWDVCVLNPEGRLAEVWRSKRTRRLQPTA
jgi:uncharacterized protein (DUF58 family)